MQREMQKALQQRDSALSQLDDYRQGHETKQPKSQVRTFIMGHTCIRKQKARMCA